MIVLFSLRAKHTSSVWLADVDVCRCRLCLIVARRVISHYKVMHIRIAGGFLNVRYDMGDHHILELLYCIVIHSARKG